eukprot:TRINITY_DN974_c0_g3_i1.p1 TRINITY_DN974_c0_g3~~TRINITY_DN974_c0_g3_i1.p1  ORF type:complete len:2565 (+),score=749.31 TRINITY_DN974_c0_g3_i1:948-7697(+)
MPDDPDSEPDLSSVESVRIPDPDGTVLVFRALDGALIYTVDTDGQDDDSERSGTGNLVSHVIYDDEGRLLAVDDEGECIDLELPEEHGEIVQQVRALCTKVGIQFAGAPPPGSPPRRKSAEQQKKEEDKTIKIGDLVRVKSSVDKPKYAWGSVKRGECGRVTEIDGATCRIDFPRQGNWRGLIEEMEKVEPPDTDKVTCHYCIKELKESSQRTSAWLCDKCKRHFSAPGPERWRCQECDWDLCGQCHTVELEKVQAKRKQEGVPTPQDDLVVCHTQMSIRFKGMAKTTVAQTQVRGAHQFSIGDRVYVSDTADKSKRKRAVVRGYAAGTAYTVHYEGGGNESDVAQDRVHALARPKLGGERPRIGCRVMLAPGAPPDGPLAPGEVGVVYCDDRDSTPFKVEIDGKKSEHYYRADRLVLVDDSPPTGLPLLEPGDPVVLSPAGAAQVDEIAGADGCLRVGEQGTVLEVDGSELGVHVDGPRGGRCWFPAHALRRPPPPSRALLDVLREEGAPEVDPDGPVLIGTAGKRIVHLPVELCLSRSLAAELGERSQLDVRLTAPPPPAPSARDPAQHCPAQLLPVQPESSQDPPPPAPAPDVEGAQPHASPWACYRVKFKAQRPTRQHKLLHIALSRVELLGPGGEALRVESVSHRQHASDDSSSSSSDDEAHDSPDALIDGDEDTEYLLKGSPTAPVVFALAEPAKLDAIRWSRGYSGKAPASWQVDAANSEDGPWVTLIQHQDASPEDRRASSGKWSRTYTVSDGLNHSAIRRLHEGCTAWVRPYTVAMQRQPRGFGGQRCTERPGVVEERSVETGMVRLRQTVKRNQGGWFKALKDPGEEEVSNWWEARFLQPGVEQWVSTRACRGKLRLCGHPHQTQLLKAQLEGQGTFIVAGGPRFSSPLSQQIMAACSKIAERGGGSCFGRALLAPDGAEAGWLLACTGGSAPRVAAALGGDLRGTPAPEVRADLLAKTISLIEQTTEAVVAHADGMVVVIGSDAARRRAARVLADVTRVREVLQRLPVGDQAVVEQHRRLLQLHSGAHLTIYKGALLQVQGMQGAIDRARRGMNALLAHHWEAVQQERWEKTVARAAATAADVRLRVPLGPRLRYMFNPPASVAAAAPAADVAEPPAAPGTDAVRRERTRQREALDNEIVDQLWSCGVMDFSSKTRYRCPHGNSHTITRSSAGGITCDMCDRPRSFRCRTCNGDWCDDHVRAVPLRIVGKATEVGDDRELVRRLIARFDEDRDRRLSQTEFQRCFEFLNQRILGSVGNALPPPDDDDISMLWHHASEGTPEGLREVLTDILFEHAQHQGVLTQFRDALEREVPPPERREKRDDRMPKADPEDASLSAKRRMQAHLQARLDAYDMVTEVRTAWAQFQTRTRERALHPSENESLASYLAAMLSVRSRAEQSVRQLCKLADEESKEVAKTLALVPERKSGGAAGSGSDAGSEEGEEEVPSGPVDVTGSLTLRASSNEEGISALTDGSEDSFWESDGEAARFGDESSWHWFEAALPEGTIHEVKLCISDQRSYTPRRVRVEIMDRKTERAPRETVRQQLDVPKPDKHEWITIVTPTEARDGTKAVRVSIMENHSSGVNTRVTGLQVMGTGCRPCPAGTAPRPSGPAWWSAKSCANVRDVLKQHTRALHDLADDLADRRLRFETWTQVALVPLRQRLVSETWRKAATGTQLVEDILARTGCLVVASDDDVILFGPAPAVRRARALLKTIDQGEWPPDSAQGEASVKVSLTVTDELTQSGGLLTHSVQALAGLTKLDVEGEKVRLRGAASAIRDGVRLLDQIGKCSAVEWQGELGKFQAEAVAEPSAPTSCPCCLVEFSQEDASVELLCGHRIHVDCGSELVKYHLSAGARQPLRCPAHADAASSPGSPVASGLQKAGCPYELAYDDFRLLAQGAGAGKAAAAYERDRVREILARRGVLVGCPRPGCSGYALRDSKEGTFENLFCLTCKSLFCPGAGAGARAHPAHFFSTCDEAQSGGAKGPGDDAATRELIEQSCRPCPGRGCGVPVYRTDACPHMTCRVCKCEWCWHCLKPYDPEDYESHGYGRGYYRCDCFPDGSETAPMRDHTQLKQRIHATVSMHKGVLFYDRTQCDVCGKFPISRDEDAHACLQCLNFYVCSPCKAHGRGCGLEGHSMGVVEREDAPEERGTLRKAPRATTGRVRDLYDIDWRAAMRSKGGALTRSGSTLTGARKTPQEPGTPEEYGLPGLPRASTSNLMGMGWHRAAQWDSDSESEL